MLHGTVILCINWKLLMRKENSYEIRSVILVLRNNKSILDSLDTLKRREVILVIFFFFYSYFILCVYKLAELHIEWKQNFKNKAPWLSWREKGNSVWEKWVGDQSKTLNYWIQFWLMTVFTYLPSSKCLLSQFFAYKRA